MGNVISLEQHLPFLIKQNRNLYRNAIIEENKENVSDKTIEELILDSFRILNEDFAHCSQATYLSEKKGYVTLEKIGLLKKEYSNSYTTTEDGRKIIDAYRRYKKMPSVKDEEERIIKDVMALTKHLEK